MWGIDGFNLVANFFTEILAILVHVAKARVGASWAAFMAKILKQRDKSGSQTNNDIVKDITTSKAKRRQHSRLMGKN